MKTLKLRLLYFKIIILKNSLMLRAFCVNGENKFGK